MEVLPLLALIVVLLVGERVWRGLRPREDARQRLERAARELGLEVQEGRDPVGATTGVWAGTGPRLVGIIGGVRVETSPFDAADSATLAVTPDQATAARLPRALELRAVTLSERLANADDVKTGDEPFDNCMLVRGAEDEILAVLDEPTRRILDDDATDPRLFEGRLAVQVRLDGLVGRVRLAVDLARRLSGPASEVAGRLARNAREDPVAEVRLRNLEALLERHPGSPVIADTLSALLDDLDPEVRLRAARALREQADSALGPAERTALLKLLGGEGADEGVARQALDALLGRASPDESWQAIDAALLHDSRWVRERALTSLLAMDGQERSTRLARLLDDPDVGIAVAAARALERHGDASCEPALVGALRVEDLGVREAVADALGAVGTTAAVMPLRHAAARLGISLLAPGLRRALSGAIERIQSRAHGADAGQVSLADGGDASGQLSLSQPSPRGALTLDGDSTRKRPRRRQLA